MEIRLGLSTIFHLPGKVTQLPGSLAFYQCTCDILGECHGYGPGASQAPTAGQCLLRGRRGFGSSCFPENFK